jgi:hypothetical protein
MIKHSLKVRAVALTAQAQAMRKVEKTYYAQARIEREKQRADRATRAEQGFFGTRNYRKHQLRNQSRAVHLARMFAAGRDYQQVEGMCESLPEYIVYDAARALEIAELEPYNYHSEQLNDSKFESYVIELGKWAGVSA